MNNLLKFLKFLAILFILLVLLVFIYFSTFKQHFKNEIKYKEAFDSVTPEADLIRKGISVELPKELMDSASAEIVLMKNSADSIYDNAKSNLNFWNNFSSERQNRHAKKMKEIDNINAGVNTYSNNMIKMAQDIQNVRSGDPDATDMTQYGTYDATLYL